MYFRRLCSNKKTKLVYSNGLSQVRLSSPFSDGDNGTANKTCIKVINELSRDTKKCRLSNELSGVILG